MALVILVGMVLALLRAVRLQGRRRAAWPQWAIPALTVVGLAVALYLSYVEVTGSPATCGPVGDCNTVQQSPHATVFGSCEPGAHRPTFLERLRPACSYLAVPTRPPALAIVRPPSEEVIVWGTVGAQIPAGLGSSVSVRR
jgi:uncharacterized membrane protein